MKSEEQLSLKSLLISLFYKNLYSVKLGPILVDSFPNLSDGLGRNSYTELISVHNYTSG